MAINILGVVEVNPLWQKQNTMEDYFEVKFVIGLFGMIVSLWTTQIWFTSEFILAFLDSVEQEPNPVIAFLAKPHFTFIISLVIGVLWTFFILKYHTVFNEINFSDQWELFSNEIIQFLQMEDEKDTRGPQIKYYLIVVIIAIFGLVTGIFYGFMYYIPFFMLFIFLAFIVSNFTGLINGLFISTMLLSWFIILYYITTKKLDKDDQSDNGSVFTDYKISKRNIDIRESEEPPVVCPSCKSFVAIENEQCPVCGDQLEIEDND